MDDEETNNVISLQTKSAGKIDAELAKHGMTRSMVEEQFAQKFTHEVPEVVHLELMRQHNRNFRQLAEEMLAAAQADVAELVQKEREIEDGIIGAKFLALACPEILDSKAQPIEKPTRKRKSRRS